MICPECRNRRTIVIDSRDVNERRAKRRRRACLKCKHRWSTIEVNVLKFRYSLQNELKREYRAQIIQAVKDDLNSALGIVFKTLVER